MGIKWNVGIDLKRRPPMIKLFYAVVTADLILLGVILMKMFIFGIVVQLNVDTNIFKG